MHFTVFLTWPNVTVTSKSIYRMPLILLNTATSITVKFAKIYDPEFGLEYLLLTLSEHNRNVESLTLPKISMGTYFNTKNSQDVNTNVKIWKIFFSSIEILFNQNRNPFSNIRELVAVSVVGFSKIPEKLFPKLRKLSAHSLVSFEECENIESLKLIEFGFHGIKETVPLFFRSLKELRIHYLEQSWEILGPSLHDSLEVLVIEEFKSRAVGSITFTGFNRLRILKLSAKAAGRMRILLPPELPSLEEFRFRSPSPKDLLGARNLLGYSALTGVSVIFKKSVKKSDTDISRVLKDLVARTDLNLILKITTSARDYLRFSYQRIRPRFNQFGTLTRPGKEKLHIRHLPAVDDSGLILLRKLFHNIRCQKSLEIVLNELLEDGFSDAETIFFNFFMKY